MPINRRAIAERLQTLAGKPEHRSKAAQLRDVMNDVEEALSKGVSRKAIIAELAKNGLVISLSTFDSNLQRHRKKQAAPSETSRNHTPSSSRNMADEKDEHPATSMSGPATLDSIINNTPDLAGYARMAKENKRSKK